MKNTLFIVAITMIAVIGFGRMIQAEEHIMDRDNGHMMRHGAKYNGQKGMMMDKPMMGGGMMMGRMMMQPKIIATSDGGVVAVVGNKLIKYDSELNVTAEAEIELDEKEMRKMMKKMHKRRMKCREMMMEKIEESKEDE